MHQASSIERGGHTFFASVIRGVDTEVNLSQKSSGSSIVIPTGFTVCKCFVGITA